MSDLHDEPMMRVCLCCPRGLYDELGRLVCERCERNIADGLAEVATLWRQLPGRLEKGTGWAADGPRVTASRVGAPLPGNPQVLDLIAGGVVGTLIVHEDAWRRELRRTYPRLPLTPWRGNQTQTLNGVLAFLNERLRWACFSYDGIEDLSQDLYRLVVKMRAVVTGEPPQRVRVLPVRCPVKPDGVRLCGGELVYDPRTRLITCRTCRDELGYEHWTDIGLAVGILAADLPTTS
ncbi:hypothetical protein [Streptomyces cavernae]|uniref:hypothetical protein n=1 Tax=Streptomyces cavernae TaxID=2259034 RepID=UPI000FEB89B6|nr:hypothetical protein [Streptomyces cavernae]